MSKITKPYSPPEFIKAAEGAKTGADILAKARAVEGRRGGQVRDRTLLQWAARGWVKAATKKEGRSSVLVSLKLTREGKRICDIAADRVNEK